MAPLDWKGVDSAPETFTSDDAEDFIDRLFEFEPGEETDPARYKKLFEVCKVLIEFKAEQVDAAEEALADQANKDAKSEAKRDQRLVLLEQEIEVLKRENKDLKRYGSADTTPGTTDTRFVREELYKSEQQVAAIMKERDELSLSLEQERENTRRYIQRYEEAEKDARERKFENDRLNEDIRDFQRQLDAQRETLLSRRDDEDAIRTTIAGKNNQLNAILQENQNLTDQLIKKDSDLRKMSQELDEGYKEIEKTTKHYNQLQMAFKTSDSVTEKLRHENERLKDQIEDLNDRVKTKSDIDDQLMVNVNNKVEEWKGILAERQMRISDLQGQIYDLNQQLVAANMDSDKASVAQLTKVVKERDQQIESLKTQLQTVTDDLEENAALIEDVRSEISHTKREKKGDSQFKKIVSLQSTLKSQSDFVKDAETRAQEAEADARLKDQELSEAIERMRQYEAGVYGLSDAVTEIKKCKTQINVRDRQIEELTQYINKCELKINEVSDVCDELRDRLGLGPSEPIDLTEVRRKRAIRTQEERALNRVLQKEVERLEEERIELRNTIRKLAQSGGQRAAALGLTGEDLVTVDNFIENLKSKRQQEAAEEIKDEAETSVLKIKALKLDQEVEQAEKKIQRLGLENSELLAKVKESEQENVQLKNGLREIHAAIKEQSDSSSQNDLRTLHCPTLDRMLAAIDAKSLVGQYDTSLYLKAQVDNLTGRNEELRSELKKTRLESSKALVDLNKLQQKFEHVENENKSLRESGAGGHFQKLRLPDGLSLTSSDVIASLNEHLTHTIQELTIKENLLETMEVKLESYQRKYAVIRHQQSLLYQDHIKQKQEWEEAESKMSSKVKEIEAQKEEAFVRIQEFDRLTENLSHDDSSLKQQLSEMTRKITVLRVNEKALTRRYTSLQEVEETLNKANSKLRNDMINMEVAVSERLAYLQRYKDMAAFKMASLQRSLDESVPAVSLEKANREYTTLTEKYRDVLEKSNGLVAVNESGSGYEMQCKHLASENSVLKSELEIEKEKLHTIEAAFEHLKKKENISADVSMSGGELTSLSRRLTTIEMKELNERQRADHADRMYEQQKLTVRRLEDRNSELESKFSELTRVHLELQKVERELRDELSECVTKSVSDVDRKRISDLETIEANLKNEIATLKDISEVASTQVRALETQQVSRDKEVTSLRQQLVDFQAQSDERTLIGKLHRHLVRLQVSEGLAVQKLDEARQKITKLEARLLRTEQRIDERDQSLNHIRTEARSKAKHLKNTIQDLRRKYSGSVPLKQQEEFTESLLKLQSDKKQTENELIKTQAERRENEDCLAALKLQHDGLQELIVTLKDGRGAQKVADWHARMEQLRIEELKQRRQIDRLKQTLKFQENIIKKHEAEVVVLEEDKVRLTKEFEDRELDWEQREVQLERSIEKLEKQQSDIASAASQFEQAAGVLPDPSWPVVKQLEHSLSTIQNNVKLIMDARAESQVFKKRVDELEHELRASAKEVTSRDKLITELRLRLPASTDRDEIILKATQNSQQNTLDDPEANQVVKVAQSTVASLQARVTQKEEAIKKYQQLLSSAREDLTTANRRHDNEMKLLQEQLHSKNDAALRKLQDTARNTIKEVQSEAPTNKQLRRLNELEDVVAEQDNSMSALREKLLRSRQEVAEWKMRHEDELRHQDDLKKELAEERANDLETWQKERAELQTQIHERELAEKTLNIELDRQKELNQRAPSTTLKNLVERLRNDLAIKEKQHKALSKALMELRADMVTQAQDDVKAHTDQMTLEMNVQKLVSKETKEYQNQNEDLQETILKQKAQIKKFKEKEATFNVELEDVRSDLTKREGQVRKLKTDKERLENEVEELEKKVDRLNKTNRERAVSSGDTSKELDELRRQNARLHDDLERERQRHQPPEKPYEEQTVSRVTAVPTSSAPPPSGPESLARWEEGKKWQRVNERLKTRLKDKDAEVEKLQKANDLLRNNLDRLKKELDSHQKTSQKPTTPSSSNKPPNVAAMHDLQAIKNINFKLEEENTNLRRQLTMNHDAAFQEVQLRNQFLRDKLEQLESQITKPGHSFQQSHQIGVDSSAYNELKEKEQDLQKQVLKLSEENIELRFEVEQNNKDIPRLKARVEDLQKYVEVLKVEKDQLQSLGSSARSISNSSLGSGSLRRIGESGRSSRDLEKTIALLKKVVERTQAENQLLKKSPGVVSNEAMRALQNENTSLKNQLEELRQKMGASLSERYSSQQKGTAKIMKDYEALRKELLKEQSLTEDLRVLVKNKEIELEKLHREKDSMKDKLEIEEAKKPTQSSLSTSEARGWRSAVVTRMYEEKLKNLEHDIEKKNQVIADQKVLLHEASERENQLQREKNRLTEQVRVLEQFPEGIDGSEAVRQYQQARVSIHQLEDEKRELLNEMQVLRREISKNAQNGSATSINDDVTAKLISYDKLLTENVELNTQLKSIDLDKTKLQREVKKLTQELSNFGPEFFEEIEDLKYNYKESVQRNVQYEDKLARISEQFGIDLNIPGL